MGTNSGLHPVRGRSLREPGVFLIIDDPMANPDADTYAKIRAILDPNALANAYLGRFTDADIFTRLRASEPLLASSGRD